RFPRDPQPPFGFDALGRYLDVEKTEPFGNYGAVIFRFDGAIEFSGFSTASMDAMMHPIEPQTRLVDLTAGPRFGQLHSVRYEISNGGDRYVCPHWFALRPYDGNPLQAGTWAVLLLKGVTASDHSMVGSSPDFDALIGSSTPTDPAQAAAYASY